MKDYRDTKVAIIGMGFLMEYMMPCHRHLLGENISRNILAVTADEHDLDRKRRVLPFPVLLNDNLGALMQMQPDIVLFAPPPRMARSLTFEVLKPYFDSVRQAGGVLPDLLACPPNPPVTFYLETLGHDIHAVNILPNVENEIGGRDVTQEGFTNMTFPDNAPWPAENRARLYEYFRPLGGIVDVPPAFIIPMLAGKVVCNRTAAAAVAISEGLADAGVAVDYHQVASAMRAFHQMLHNYHPAGSLPCAADAVPAPVRLVLERFVASWYAGIKCFLLEIGMPEMDVDKLMSYEMDIHLQAEQTMDRAALDARTHGHATKGGVLEMGCITFDRLVHDDLRDAFRRFAEFQFDDAWFDSMQTMSYRLASIVMAHGYSLGAPKPDFDIVHHAVLFGFFARNAALMAGDAGLRAIREAVRTYGRERGGRMAQRARADGQEPTMANYLAYGEWQARPGQMEMTTLEKSPIYQTRVTRCEWNETWKRFGLAEYGHLYCENVDTSLVDGFTGADTLKVHSFLSCGAPCCHFEWTGFDMNPESEAAFLDLKQRNSSRHVRGFDYHTAHLYVAFARVLEQQLGEQGSAIVRQTQADFKAAFSDEHLNAVLALRDTDFTRA